MKKCPFCKNEIEVNSAQCPVCKQTLIEKVSSSRPAQGQYNSPPPKEPKERAYTYNTAPKSPPAPKRRFQIPKGKGWIFSIIGSILLTIILSSGNSSSSNLPSSDPLPTPLPITIPISTDFQPISPIPVPHVPYYSLPNGTVLYASSSNGSGVLTISNGSGSDAAVKLITSSGVKDYYVYIRANNTYSIKNINDGIYRVAFAFGSNWDTEQEKFLVNPSAEFFDDTFDFETSDAQDSIQYTVFTITLNPVVDGTATTSSLDPNEFYKY